MHGRTLIGTSGWSYDHWTGPFYPGDLKAAGRLGFYARHFPAVEINNTFYSTPKPETFESWRADTPDGFVFAVKASRFITHMKKLKDPADPLKRFLDAVAPLGDRLGPVLFQLPPNWRVNTERLAGFLEALPAQGRYVMEFRDESWFDEAVYALLRQKNVALCLYDLAGWTSPVEVTADFAYVRLHGPDEGYAGRYDARTLREWAARFRDWNADGRDVYCFFDNDAEAAAVHDAQALQEMVDASG